MSNDTVVSLGAPARVWDPLTEVLRAGARRLTAPLRGHVPEYTLGNIPGRARTSARKRAQLTPDGNATKPRPPSARTSNSHQSGTPGPTAAGPRNARRREAGEPPESSVLPCVSTPLTRGSPRVHLLTRKTDPPLGLLGRGGAWSRFVKLRGAPDNPDYIKVIWSFWRGDIFDASMYIKSRWR